MTFKPCRDVPCTCNALHCGTVDTLAYILLLKGLEQREYKTQNTKQQPKQKKSCARHMKPRSLQGAQQRLDGDRRRLGGGRRRSDGTRHWLKGAVGGQLAAFDNFKTKMHRVLKDRLIKDGDTRRGAVEDSPHVHELGLSRLGVIRNCTSHCLQQVHRRLYPNTCTQGAAASVPMTHTQPRSSRECFPKNLPYPLSVKCAVPSLPFHRGGLHSGFRLAWAQSSFCCCTHRSQVTHPLSTHAPQQAHNENSDSNQHEFSAAPTQNCTTPPVDLDHNQKDCHATQFPPSSPTSRESPYLDRGGGG